MTANVSTPVSTPVTTPTVNVTATPAAPSSNMNKAQGKTPSEPSSVAPTRLWPMVVATLAMVVAALCLVVSYWMYQKTLKVTRDIAAVDTQLSTQKADVDKRLNDAETQMKETLSQQQEVISKLPAQAETWLAPQIQPIRQALDLEKQTNATQESRLASMETRQDAAQNLLAELPTQKVLWQMMEVVQLARVALVRLKVEHDVSSAQASLTLATDILRRLHLNDKGVLLAQAEKASQSLAQQTSADPYVVNQQLITLTKDIQSLMFDADTKPDLVNTLNQKDIDSQPSLAASGATPRTGLPWYQALWRDAFSELGGLVRFTPEDRPLMPPDGAFFIEQNIALSILTLRSALLRHDSATFAAERQQLSAWIERYAEKGEAKTKVLNHLAKLQQLSFNVDANELKQWVSDTELALNRLQQASGGRP